MSSYELVMLLLRDPAGAARRCDEERDLRPLALLSVLCALFGTAAFGAVLGSFRGGEQIAFCAIKVPLAFFVTLVVCVPAFHATTVVLGAQRSLRSIAALTLCAAARASLVLLAFTPVLWLVVSDGSASDYHRNVLLAVAFYGIAGTAALGVLVRGVGKGATAPLATAVCLAIFFAVGAQSAWIARPFLGRPTHRELPFFRAPEGGFVGAVMTSGRSATGHYDEGTR